MLYLELKPHTIIKFKSKHYNKKHFYMQVFMLNTLFVNHFSNHNFEMEKVQKSNASKKCYNCQLHSKVPCLSIDL